jgi:HemK-like putative methylase
VRWVHGRFPDDVVEEIEVCQHTDVGRKRRFLHAIAANPPYIPSSEVEQLAPEQREYEPRLALDGGPDGFEVIRSIIEQGPRLLCPGGVLAMEIAAGQAEVVRELVAEHADWREVEILPDLAGIPRVLIARTVGAERRDASVDRRSG